MHPAKTTEKAIENFRRQLKSLGLSYDWEREISTCDPQTYRWTQYLFLQLYKKGLAYQKEASVNWCPALRTVLANEEVTEGVSERGGHPVEQVPMKQWMLKITDYAQDLLEGLDIIDWPERTKDGQRHWIGRSEGMRLRFSVVVTKKSKLSCVEVYTTRPDTIFGVTFVILSPEHPLVERLTVTSEKPKMQAYLKSIQGKKEVERLAEMPKTGAFTGSYVSHPITQAPLPIWVSDFVLMHYGTGAIMGTPAHDERDYAFARAFQLKVQPVVEPISKVAAATPSKAEEPSQPPEEGEVSCYTGEGAHD